MATCNVLIAASGTGGHLFPALYIGKAIKAIRPESNVEFVGSGRALEAEIIDKAGFKRHLISAVGVKRRGLRGVLEFALTFPKAFLQTRKLFNDFQPDLVVGVGGYVTFFPVLLAWLRGVPSWIHEAELRPGLANQVLSFFARRISYSFQEASISTKRKAVFTGHPVREEIKQVAALNESCTGPRNILILGGSQGADAIDRALQELAPKIAGRGLSLWHQARPENVQQLKQAYQLAGIDAQVVPFVHEMATAYGWAHLIICRAGAGTVMELSVINKPAVLIPYPFAQGDHQSANAMTLVKAGKAVLVDERPGRDGFDSLQSFAARLWQALEQILEPSFYHAMQSRPYAGRKMDAAHEIALAAIELAGK